MSITTADARPHRRATLAGLCLALATALTGCSFADHSSRRPASGGRAADEVVPLVRQVLNQRARSLRAGDAAAFLATTAQERPRFVASQRVYFDNLMQLPLGVLTYRLDASSLVSADGEYAAVVQVHLQLEGYDEVPVVRPTRFHFTRHPDGDAMLVAGDRDPAWERRNDVTVPPWVRGPITVRIGTGVLGVFDDESAVRAEDVISAVEEGIGRVQQVVPSEWSGNVVVYALSETDMLEALDDLPGGDPDALDAVAFPVPATPGGEHGVVASTRFLLHPRMLDSDPRRLARLIRHELTHVALGSRDDDLPTWLSEGIAEWVSVQALPEHQRLISQQAIDAARAGLDELPDDVDFNGEDQAEHYGISWWACEAIVDMYGEEMLWLLLDELAAAGPADQADVLQQTLQLGPGQLAREAGKRIVATYG
ncbi:MAG: hypothetical protein JWN68_3144 [Nocardioides sp.]|jgi:hypothetical protein|uniref:hypothetical protein n=1 Tax=Nocardioides sp. TaxID=35761 RepID=UPI002618677C|nr:hypothetical protein [Nocardioides sp.]MCW2835191.1 hypothetical protein [Nocardioides sp.]